MGSIRLANVPVAVHEGTLPADQLSRLFGVELGPIVGTNVFKQFLSTIDAKNHRFVLSPRGNAATRAEHPARVPRDVMEVPFAMWNEHYMIVRGRMGSHAETNLFVDTGLVAATPDGGQAALLASRRTLESWGASSPKAGRLVDLPGELAIGPARRENVSAFCVSNRQWRDFGAWGGIQVDALISWGFLKNFVWTIDFDQRQYRFAGSESAQVSQ
jgi:hypothetical protein